MFTRTGMMTPNDSTTQQQPDRLAVCPSCGCESLFSYAGITCWPERVAQLAGIDPDVRLWNCTGCDTTLCEQELEWELS